MKVVSRRAACGSAAVIASCLTQRWRRCSNDSTPRPKSTLYHRLHTTMTRTWLCLRRPTLMMSTRLRQLMCSVARKPVDSLAVPQLIESLAHGQVWWADLDDAKVRPVVVLTRGRVASRLSRVLVAPVTSTIRGLPTEVVVGPAEGLRGGSVANLDNSQLIEVDRLLERCGSVQSHRWPEFCAAMQRVLGCGRGSRS